MIRYVSTRGTGKPQGFMDVLLSGTAPDGGLYVPEVWPEIDLRLLEHLQGLSYAEIAMQVISLFTGKAISPEDLQRMIGQTYEGGAFDHSAVAPLVQIGPNAWILELFHGPTLSFKDYALQLLGRLFDYVLEKQGRRVTIIGATSGDTGSAAIEACRNCRHIDIVILYPQGRTSDVQRRQMTHVNAENVSAVAIEGTFDDCQALVKAMFADKALCAELNLSAVNSINWVRIMAQMVYYVAAAVALGAPQRPVSFTVPTGNFGNVYAAWGARRMGLPVHRLVVASNRNDILTRFFETGTMQMEEVMPSLSPSMDIQVSSNFERYLLDLLGNDGNRLRVMMQDFSARHVFSVDPALMARARAEFIARRCGDPDALATMKSCFEATGIMIDPHTAVGLHAASDVMAQDPAVPMVVLACAHPAKFPDAVEQATGRPPPVPGRLAAVLKKPEYLTVLPNKIDKVRQFVRNAVRK